MIVPKTFSAPPIPTWPSLLGYAPSIEDCVRYAVWLMFYSDDVVRRTYSFDDERPERGVRIVQQQAYGDPETGQLSLPQLVVGIAIPNTQWRFLTSGQGEKKITVAVMHLEPIDTSWLDVDVDAPPMTPETRLARFEEILMRGTLYEPALALHTVPLVDPYYSPRLPDGTYDPASFRLLTTKAPEVRPTAKKTFPNRNVRTEAEFYALDPVTDFGLSYGLFATYTIDVSNRGDMRHGGTNG